MSTHDTSAVTTHHLGQRLSLNSQACTVRYIGTVQGKTGEWLGVEWDNTLRGRNNGTHDGVVYFRCKSSSATAASFIRPAQAWDIPRTFLEALADKYFRVEDARSDEILLVSRSKQYEEVGFEKFAQRQAKLKGIHVLILDHMRIGQHLPQADVQSIAGLCANITDLDLGSNLFEQLDDILKLCSHLHKLRSLTLDGNRLQISPESSRSRRLEQLRNLSLNDTHFTEGELSHLLQAFPSIEQLELARNELDTMQTSTLPKTLHTINLAENRFRSMDMMSAILQLPKLNTLKLKDNLIEKAVSRQPTSLSTTLVDLDLGRNAISNWQVIDQLPIVFPGLCSVRVSGNPLYAATTSASGKPVAAEDGYMLTIARLPQVHTLNFSTVRDLDRLNAEKYYLSEIAVELSRHDEKDAPRIKAKHPRWKALCEEYGEPEIDRATPDDINPNSLEARLLTVDYYTSTTISGSLEVPRAWNTYALYGLLAKRLETMPVNLKLTWETDEQDPVSQYDSYNGPEWWDSDEEDATEELTWTMRSVELKPGTRAIGTYCTSRRAKIRVDVST